MALTTTFSRRFRKPFYLDAHRLSAIWKIVADDNRKIIFRTADGNSHETSNIDDVLSYPNSRSRAITALEVSNSYHSEVRISVEFDNDPTISIRLIGESYKVAGVEQQILPLIEGALLKHPVFRQWQTST